MDPQQSLDAMKQMRKERGRNAEALEKSRFTSKIWAAIRDALSQNDLTAPEIAKATGFQADTVFWHINALRKYGEVEIAGEADSYLRYRRVKRGQ